MSSYGSSTESSGVVRILKDLDASIEGRDVLIVEDIVDSGLTLSYLLRTLSARDPASLEVCALLEKPERRKVDLDPLHGLRDPQPVRDRLRARPRGAVPQPAVRGGSQPKRALRPNNPLLGWGFTFLGREDLSREQILQERRVPDPDRGGAGVLRPEAHQPGRPRGGSELLAVPRPRSTGPGQGGHAQHEEQHDRRRARSGDEKKYQTAYPDNTEQNLVNLLRDENKPGGEVDVR